MCTVTIVVWTVVGNQGTIFSYIRPVSLFQINNMSILASEVNGKNKQTNEKWNTRF